MTPADWHARLLASAEAAAAGRPDPALPGFPPEEVQRAYNSGPAQQTMGKAFELYARAMAACRDHGPAGAEGGAGGGRFLDFGAGWGRIWRYFLRDFAPERMAAFDVNPRLAPFWEASMLGARLDVAAPFEPLPYADASFDLVLANSVFSHLSERLNLHSAREISRILRPGGLLVATTYGLPHLKRLRARIARGEAPHGRWRLREGLTAEFDAAIARFADGGFAFVATDDTAPTDYENAAFGPAWLATAWGDRFETVSFDPDVPAQPVFVCRAR